MKNLTTKLEMAMANTKTGTATADDIEVKTTTANDINVETAMANDAKAADAAILWPDKAGLNLSMTDNGKS